MAVCVYIIVDAQVTWNEEERKSLVLRQHSYRSAVRDFGESRSRPALPARLRLLLANSFTRRLEQQQQKMHR